MPRAWSIAVARVAALVTCVGLATSRIGLIAHELLGHGGTAIAMGGSITHVQLYWFAGGWVTYRATQGEVPIALGGIAVEMCIGTVVWFALARRTTLGGRITRALGAVLVLHATWYLATGTWHGYGDGIVLHRELGDAKWLVAVPAALVTLAAAYAGARCVFGALAATVPGGTRARIAGTAIAFVVAGGVQLAAAVTEVQVRREAAYLGMMQPERERVVARELARWERAQPERPSDDARAQMKRELAAQHQTFPFAIVLAVLTVLAVIAGGVRARGAEPGPVASPLLVRAALLAGGSIALVIAIDVLFH